MFRVSLTAACLLVSNLVTAPVASAMEIYFFRGAGDLSMIQKDLHFSRGLDEMAEILNNEGITSEVRRFEQVDDGLAAIRSRGSRKIVLVGHSMGALASLDIAKRLQSEGVTVAYMGLIDIPGHFSSVTSNVEWVDDYYSDNPAFGRLLNASSHPNARAFHISGPMHNQLDDVPALKQAMLTAIRQVYHHDQQQTAPQWVAQTPDIDDESQSVSALSTGNAVTAAGAGQPHPLPIAGQFAELPPVTANVPTQHVGNGIAIPEGLDPQTTASTLKKPKKPLRNFSQR